MSRDNLRQLRDEAIRAITAGSEPRRRSATGTIVGYSLNEAGQVQAWTVRMDDAEEDVTEQVPPRGQAGESVGATVLLEGVGGPSGALWDIRRVTRPGGGTGGTSPTIPLATPEIDSIQTTIQILQGGAILVYAWLTTYLIVAQWRQGQMIGYEAEVRNAAGAVVATSSVAPFGSVYGVLDDALDDSATTFDLAADGTPELFRESWGIVGVEDELMLFRRYNRTTRIFTDVTRGYDSTSAAAHADASLVRLRAIGIPTSGMEPGKNYEARVRAFAADGRVSTWTDWTPFTTVSDTTPPTWSGSPSLLVNAVADGFSVSWVEADTDADDIDHYQVRYSHDESTWTTKDAGRATEWLLRGEVGDYRFFQVRAVDSSGNASAWSSSVRVFIPSTRKVRGANMLSNPEFTLNIDDWGWTAPSLTVEHESTNGAALSGALKVHGPRDSISEQTVYQDLLTGVQAGQRWLGRVYVAVSENFDETSGGLDDRVQLILEMNTAQYVTAIEGADIARIGSGNWTLLEVEGVVPAGVTKIAFMLDVDAAGSPSENFEVYFDTAGLFLLAENTKGEQTGSAAEFDQLALGGTDLETRLSAIEGDTGTLDGRVDALEVDVADLEDAVEALETAVSDIESEIFDARAGKGTLDARLDQMETSINALEPFYARYTTNAGQNLTTGSNIVIDYEDMAFESVDYVTIGASWKFQPTVAGVYEFSASFMMASSNWSSGDMFQIGIRKNGNTLTPYYRRIYVPALTSQTPQVTIKGMVELNGSTDYVQITGGGAWAAGGNKPLSTDPRHNWVEIKKVG